MKEYFITEDETVVICSHISVMTVGDDYDTHYDDGKAVEYGYVYALLDGHTVQHFTRGMPKDQCQGRLKEIIKEIFES